MEHLRQATEKIEKEISRLTLLNQQLTENLKLLFEEEEIKECSNYELFKMVYSVSTANEVPSGSRTKAQSKTAGREHIELPSIYAPKGSRTKAAIAMAAPTPAFERKPKEELEQEDVCLLPDENKIVVDQVRVGDVIYLFSNGKFYDSSTGAQVGQIEFNMITIKGEPFSLSEKVLTHSSDDYYTDGQNGIYLKCNEHVARLVGEQRNDDIYEFS